MNVMKKKRIAPRTPPDSHPATVKMITRTRKESAAGPVILYSGVSIPPAPALLASGGAVRFYTQPALPRITTSKRLTAFRQPFEEPVIALTVTL